MNKLAEKLRNRPIVVDEWAYKMVGQRNEGPFKRLYQELRVLPERDKKNNELVDVSRLGIVNRDYYFEKCIGVGNKCNKFSAEGIIFPYILLRKSHAKRLLKADCYLRKIGLFLNIVSGWRHPKLQQMIKDDYAKKHGKEVANRLFASIDKKVPPPHSTGAAFDAEVRYLESGNVLNTVVKYKGEKVNSIYWGEELLKKGKLKNKADQEAVLNRRILYHILCTKNILFTSERDLFFVHPGEYWHYGEGETLSSFLARKRSIRCGLIYPVLDIKKDNPDIE
jgi:D-alanyl-D-alanine dipeptidase